jgi:hypothetical protein
MPDADVSLDLHAVLNRVYDAAGYRHYIYKFMPDPQLSAADAQWTALVLREMGTPAL